MNVDYSPRGSGKTTRLIEWLRGDPKRVLITISHEHEKDLRQLYPELGMQIVGWESYRRKYRGGHITEVAIDNADIILQKMIPEKIAIVTISSNDISNL
jgi:hypothetical protein